MLSRLFKSSQTNSLPRQLYGSVVAQSRKSEFFTGFGFNDDVTGRFDVLCLHLYLFSRRLTREKTKIAQSLNQEVFDCFVEETDRALRELGVGDTSVPKRKKKLVRGFYALLELLEEPLNTNNMQDLQTALHSRFTDNAVNKNIADAANNDTQNKINIKLLAPYIMTLVEQLDQIPMAKIMEGKIDWKIVDIQSKSNLRTR